jgi:N4-gp56 family major capsid protein
VTWENFIPEIWSAQFVQQFQKALVFGGPSVCNHDYEGEIGAYGDTVNITSIGDVTVSDYDDTEDLDYEDVPTSSQKLVIDQQKAFAVGVKDIDKAQSRNGGAAVAQLMSTAAYRMSDAADQFVALAAYNSTAAGNVLDAVTDFSDAGTAYETLVDLRTALSEASVPTEGRYAIVPSWYYGLLLKDDRFTRADSYGSTSALINGEVGRAAGFAILESQNGVEPSDGTTYNVQAGTPMATSFANNLIEHEVIRDPNRFRDLMRGLHVYGGKVTYPDGLARVTCTRP